MTTDGVTVADVAFDTPVPHPFSYLVPQGWSVTPGQRVFAPLGGAARVGVVVEVREDTARGLKPLTAVVDEAVALAPAHLDLARWIATQSLSSLGSTCAALLPPPPPATPRAARRERTGAGAARGGLPPSLHASTREGTSPSGTLPARAGHPLPPRHPPAREVLHPDVESRPELLLGAGRERRLVEALARGPALLLVPDLESAARWTTRLASRHGARAVARVDSSVSDGERAAAWRALERGAARVAVGTRSALLVPLPAGATLAVLDEHEAAHKPPGPPRMHTRDIVLERGRREPLRVLLTSATPSVETWWRTTSGSILAEAPPPAPWPAVSVADTRGILRREPLTPDLSRALRETLAAGRRALLVVSRAVASLACEDCGAILRCPTCAIALAYARAAAALACRLCGETVPLPDTCPHCGGRRLTPFGWSAERVEQAVRRRFPRAAIARYDGEARGKRAEAQRAAAAGADVIVGTRGAVRLFGPAALGLAAFVSPDHQLRLPDFRAAERAFALMWAVTERVRADGAVIVQSQNPEHYGLAAVVAHDLDTFYRQELKFRAELAYPPFRRLAVITARGREPGEAARLAGAAAAALRGARQLTVYPPAPGRGARTWRVVVKGGDGLPAALETGLGELRAGTRSRGIINVEVDPVEWPS
jgi:primosomal protein N' (replication factor Y)